MTPQDQLQQSDGMAGLRSLIPEGSLAEPDAAQMSAGIMDGLRQALSIVTTTAESVPALAKQARDAKQLLMGMMLAVQQSTTPEGNGGGGY